jgi:crossover junction endodeoxyribonuclease RuvC
LIKTPKGALGPRLLQIQEELEALIVEHRPEALALEKVFFTKNQTTAMDVARASGVILVTCCAKGLDVTEYSPPEIKLSVVGHGGAEKKQIQFMVVKLLGLAVAPKPDDVADALAIALCHALRTPGR